MPLERILVHLRVGSDGLVRSDFRVAPSSNNRWQMLAWGTVHMHRWTSMLDLFRMHDKLIEWQNRNEKCCPWGNDVDYKTVYDELCELSEAVTHASYSKKMDDYLWSSRLLLSLPALRARYKDDRELSDTWEWDEDVCDTEDAHRIIDDLLSTIDDVKRAADYQFFERCVRLSHGGID